MKKIISLLICILLITSLANSYATIQIKPNTTTEIQLLNTLLSKKEIFNYEDAINKKEIQIKSIQLNKNEATLVKGKSLQLKVKKIKPSNASNKDVEWTTSNKKVATVDGKGKVKAKGKGICLITCAALDGSGVTAICTITVNDSSKTSGTYVGNKSTKIFHLSTCRTVRRMSEKNKIFFDLRQEAIKLGYRACKVCHP